MNSTLGGKQDKISTVYICASYNVKITASEVMQISDGPTTPQTRRVLKNKRVNSGSFNSVLCPGMQSELTTYFCTHLLGIEADIHELFLVLCSMLFHHHNGGGGGGHFEKAWLRLACKGGPMAFTWSTISSPFGQTPS